MTADSPVLRLEAVGVDVGLHDMYRLEDRTARTRHVLLDGSHHDTVLWGATLKETICA